MPNVGDVNVRITASTAQFTAAMAKVNSSLDRASTALTTMGTKLSLGLTVPLGLATRAVVKAAAEFESSFTGIRKTVNATEAEFAQLESQLRAMTRVKPIDVNELNRVGEAAGQLGIQTKNLAGFVDVMSDLGVTTNLSSTEAATALARISNIMGVAQDQFSNMGSAIVDLGNNFATTEREIVEMSTRLAPAGKAVNLTADQVFGLAAALSSVGVEAQAGGSSIARALIKMSNAVKSNSEELETFAQVSRMSVSDFKQAFEKDAARAVQSFVVGLGDISKAGGNMFAVLEKLELNDIRLIQSLVALSNASGLVGRAMDVSSVAYRQNTALAEEARKRYKTFESQMLILGNRLNDVKIIIGAGMIDAFRASGGVVERFIGTLEGAARAFKNMDSSTRNLFIAIAGVGAVIGPVLLAFGFLVKFVTPMALLSATALALGAAAVVIVSNWEAVAPHLSRIWEGLQADLERWVTGMVGDENLRRIRSMADSIASVFGGIKTVILGLVEFIETTLRSAWAGVKAIWAGDTQALLHVVREWVANGVVPLVNLVMGIVQQQVGRIWQGLKALWAMDTEALFQVVSEWWRGSVEPILKNVHQFVGDLVGAAWSGLPETWQASLADLSSAVAAWWQSLGTLLTNIPLFIGNTIKFIWRGIDAIWNGDLTQLQMSVSDWWLKDVLPILQNLKTHIENSVAVVWNTLPEQWRTALAPLTTVVSEVWEAIFATLQGKGEEGTRSFDFGVAVGQWIKDFRAAMPELTAATAAEFAVLGAKAWEAFVEAFIGLFTTRGVKALFPFDVFAVDFGRGLLEGLGVIEPALKETQNAMTQTTETLSDTTQQFKEATAEAARFGETLRNIPRGEAIGASTDLFNRRNKNATGPFIPGEQPETLANGMTRSFEQAIRKATELEARLEQLTTDVPGLRAAMQELEQMELATRDFKILPMDQQHAILADFADMAKAMNVLWQNTALSNDRTTATMAQQMYNRLNQLANDLVWNSIWTDMTIEMKDRWMFMSKEITDEAGGLANALTTRINGIELNPGFETAGNAIRLFGQDFRQEVAQIESTGFDAFESVGMALARFAGEGSESLGPILVALKEFKAALANVADESGVLQAIQNFQEALASTQEIKLPTAAVQSFGDIWKTLGEDLQVVRAKTDVLGRSFDKVEAEIRAMETALIDLHVAQQQGLVLSDEQQMKLVELEEKLRDRRGQQALMQGFKDASDAVRGSLRDMVRGVFQGTQSMSELFDNLVQNIIVSLTSKALDRAIDALFNKLMDVVFAAQQAQSFSAAPSGFGGGGGVLGSLVSIAGTAIGSYFGGPAGGAIGGSISSASLGSFQSTPSFSGLGAGSGSLSFSGAGAGGLQAGRLFGSFAKGGSMPPNELGLVGEEGPEIVNSGTLGMGITPLDPRMFTPKVEINIINRSEESVTQESRQNSSGGQTIDVIIGEAVKRDANNGGPGIRAIQRALGASRVGGQR